MTTCREFFTFSWPLRGRGEGGVDPSGQPDRFLRVFFFITSLGCFLQCFCFFVVTTSCFYCITFSHCQLAANRLGDYFPLPSLPPSSLVNCHIFPPLSPSFIDLVYNVHVPCWNTYCQLNRFPQKMVVNSECHQAAASDLCGHHHCANKNIPWSSFGDEVFRSMKFS